jgi:tRNA A-37 threonylcarbamoyl transferase component Bud32
MLADWWKRFTGGAKSSEVVTTSATAINSVSPVTTVSSVSTNPTVLTVKKSAPELAMLEALGRPPIRRPTTRSALPASAVPLVISTLEEAELVAALKALEGGMSERQAIEAIERAAKRGVAPERLRVAAASVAVQRAELDRALDLLEGCNEISSRVLRAEVHAARGDLGQACACLSEALADDVTIPGGWDRLRRWRAALSSQPSMVDAVESTRADATLLLPTDRSTPFTIVAEVGRGASATVYEAIDDTLGRRVALKVYHRPVEHRALLEREARIGARLAGPGVVAVYDMNESADAGWIALEWAELGPLRGVIARGDRSVLNPAREWVARLVEVLSLVHKSGWVHGDVKPGNVLFRAPGQPLLTDFGVTRQPGEIYTGGTLAYSSPERLAGRTAHPDDDVFGLGKLLFDVAELIDLADRPWVMALGERCVLASGARPSSAEQIWL